MRWLSEETVADVMSTLSLIPRWELRLEEWELVMVSLRRLGEALERNEEAGVYRALEEVERFGPSRLASIARSAGEEKEPGRTRPPEPVMEFLNTLVHPAGGWSSPRENDSTEDEG